MVPPRPKAEKIVVHPTSKQAIAVLLSVFALGSGWTAFNKAVMLPAFVEELRDKFASREAVQEVSDQVRELRIEMKDRFMRLEDRMLQLERDK
jgi:hypothetical protein